MQIRELRLGNESAWITPAKSYWDTEIDTRCISEGWTNAEAMKTSAHTFIDALQTAYTAYKSGEDIDALKRALLVIYGHVSMKYNLNVAGTPPTIPVIITGDDIRNFYINWSSQLPDYEDIITLEPDTPEPEDPPPEEPPEVTEGKVVETEDYTNCLSTITSGNSSDSAGLLAIELSLSGNVRPFMINMLYAKPVTSSNNIDIKPFVLDTMFLQDVLDEFGFVIQGLND